jgi:hypothetical protein
MVRPTSAGDINSRSLLVEASLVPKVTLTSFSASLDGSLKDVELAGELSIANLVSYLTAAGVAASRLAR